MGSCDSSIRRVRVVFVAVTAAPMLVLGCSKPPPARPMPAMSGRIDAPPPVAALPPDADAPGGGNPGIEPGQSVRVVLSSDGLTLDGVSLGAGSFDRDLEALMARPGFPDAVVTVSIEKDARVLERRKLIDRLKAVNVRHELEEVFRNGN